MAHDQSFKNLILDYPQQALRAPGSSEDRGRRPLLRDRRSCRSDLWSRPARCL